ncbi:MAG: hypothetical protein QOD99_2410 [Chthoniobacter sp.]|jgi:uncharacterized membrane protein|nr:hypothetical protein [Chthoniobacter sp.]
MNEGQFQQHRDESLSRGRAVAVTIGFYGVALATGAALAIDSQASGIHLYLILVVGSVMGALATYFMVVAISYGVRSFRRHFRNSSTNDNSRNA